MGDKRDHDQREAFMSDVLRRARAAPCPFLEEGVRVSIRQSDVERAQQATMLLVECAHRLPAFAVRAREWERGGLPANSMPEGLSGTSEPLLPAFDRTDQRLHADLAQIRTMLHGKNSLMNQIQALDRILNYWLLVADALPDPPPCENLACGNLLDGTRTKGECSRCRSWKSRHGGLAYPLEPANAK